MRKLALLFLGASLSSAAVNDWLPGHIGDRWVYDVKILSGNPTHPAVEEWQEEVVTTAIRSVPDGMLIARGVRLLNHTSSGPSAARWSSESDILVRRNCLYFVSESPGSDLADVCLPLHAGARWGDVAKYREVWRVAGNGHKIPASEPDSIGKDAWRLEAHLASGDDDYVWFQKDVGVVAKRMLHHGTYDDERVELLNFRPGK